jgi:hypothetical protein
VKFTSDIASIPGTLYFTPEVFDQFNELCVLKRLTPTQLIVEAINSQGARWEEFIDGWTLAASANLECARRPSEKSRA